MSWRVETAVNNFVIEAVSNRVANVFLTFQTRLAYP